MTSDEQQALINSVENLIGAQVHRCGDKNPDLWPDLMQEGRLGALRATYKWDKAESKFSTYSYFWIKDAIFTALRLETPLYVSNRSYDEEKDRTKIWPKRVDFEETSYEDDFKVASSKLRKCLMSLTDKEFRIITHKYGIGCEELSSAEIAIKEEITEQTVRYHLRNILAKLNVMMTSQEIK